MRISQRPRAAVKAGPREAAKVGEKVGKRLEISHLFSHVAGPMEIETSTPNSELFCAGNMTSTPNFEIFLQNNDKHP